MKFTKELEQELVPEWRLKYLNYKSGKKLVKAISKAQSHVPSMPWTAEPDQQPRKHSLYGATSPIQPRTRPAAAFGGFDGPNEVAANGLHISAGTVVVDNVPNAGVSAHNPFGLVPVTNAMSIPAHHRAPVDENVFYGSFVATPPDRARADGDLSDPASGPSPADDGAISPTGASSTLPSTRTLADGSVSTAAPDKANAVAWTLTPVLRKNSFASLRHRPPPSSGVRPFMRRAFSIGAPLEPSESEQIDAVMMAVEQVRDRQKVFYGFMDSELEKVETFYRTKENEAGERLKVLREQLHEMRNRRIEEVTEARLTPIIKQVDGSKSPNFGTRGYGKSKKDDDYRPDSREGLAAWLTPFERAYGSTKAKITGSRFGTNSHALPHMPHTPKMGAGTQAQKHQQRSRYSDAVPYRKAKRKLKLALQELYRGMELLKSYALLNRTAFLKLNKKYDKAVGSHPPLQFMSGRVNKAWFVNSYALESHLNAVEDLYARYFERGNYKIASGKLRSSTQRRANHASNVFRNGVFIGLGAVLAVQGIIHGVELLHDPNPVLSLQTSYLLQIYGGYFLALYLFSWFCLACNIWARNKINYQFVFEFDSRHTLDWRQLAEFPSFLVLLLGLCVWLNFAETGGPRMYLSWPLLLMSITTLLIFFPGPYFFHRSRRWFLYSHWRLFLAGLYPVEFRDFFLGDMYCSLTYAMSNIELFFCLYVNWWNDPVRCNSTHSRLFGFLSTVPAIWRALQCLRRYYNTRDVFPHLVNGGKYVMTMTFLAMLSVYRIDQDKVNLAIFITFAAINSLYSIVWDLLMDWSLFQPNASKWLLRDVRGYKSAYCYYAAMFFDPILRFNWIFLALYPPTSQYSTLVAFFVAFSEVTRRGVWVLFRVENEHCSNVVHFKAYRDMPLPYTAPIEEQPTSPESRRASQSSIAINRLRRHTAATLEAQTTRRHSTSRSIRSIVADAHTQDFEKKRRPSAADGDSRSNYRWNQEEDDVDTKDGDDDSDEDYEDEQQTVVDAEALVREARANGQYPHGGFI